MNGLLAFNDTKEEMKVRKYPIDDFGDAPDELRWRATWDSAWDGEIIGIALTAYPVTKLTPKGAWIAKHAYLQATKQPWEEGAPYNEWTFLDDVRWVSNDGGAAWAKRTQQEALDSLLIRFSRWTNRIQGDIDYFLSAAEALEKLYPEQKVKAQVAREMVRGRVTL